MGDAVVIVAATIGLLMVVILAWITSETTAARQEAAQRLLPLCRRNPEE